MQEARVHLGCAKLVPACARTAAELVPADKARFQIGDEDAGVKEL
jgi:hypothetical protein